MVDHPLIRELRKSASSTRVPSVSRGASTGVRRDVKTKAAKVRKNIVKRPGGIVTTPAKRGQKLA